MLVEIEGIETILLWNDGFTKIKEVEERESWFSQKLRGPEGGVGLLDGDLR